MLVHSTALGTALSTALASGLHRSLLASGTLSADGSGTPASSGRELAFAALGSWLLTEVLGAYMLRNWFVRGGAHEQRDTARTERMPVPFVLGHAGMAATGFVCWIIFLASTAPVAAWLALGFLVPAIGFGVSTVTVWTPYPGRRRARDRDSPGWKTAGAGASEIAGPSANADPSGNADPSAITDRSANADPSGNEGPSASVVGAAGVRWPEQGTASGVIPDAHLHRALEDEALTRQLIDDLLATNLAGDPLTERRGPLDPRALVPFAHGVLAIATFLLVTLAAIAA